MRTLTSATFGAALALIAGATGASAAPAPAATAQPMACNGALSAGARPALADFQAAIATKDAAKIATADAAAQAKAKAPADICTLGQLELQAAGQANDFTAASAAVTRALGSGAANGTLFAPVVANIGANQYNSKNYAGAYASFMQASQLNPNDPEPLVFAAGAKAKMNDSAAAIALYQRAFALRAKGATLKQEWLAQAVADAYRAKSPAVVPLTVDWVSAYPTPSNWHDTLQIYAGAAGLDATALIDVYRLERATKGLTAEGDYANFANLLLGKGYANEAKAVLAEGVAANLVKPTSPVVVEARQRAPGEIAGLAASAAAARTAASGQVALNVGERLYGTGDYAKAAELFRIAATKPGADSATANLKLGEALAMSGDTAGAKAAFQAVTGPKADLAKFWLIWLGQRG
ncbi:hypothetical protein ABDK56_01935 [Sphingomonas sp. ASV193]|uniref:hypothetical protein n=1 Tax=Sphingomonas sp. ASV193 TaxID=3144405 RepID=UPI0032E86DD6